MAQEGASGSTGRTQSTSFLPMFENKRLHIYGRPDGIDAANGALIPLEIKSHKDVKPTDEWSLRSIGSSSNLSHPAY
jgi:hypothetical protein